MPTRPPKPIDRPASPRMKVRHRGPIGPRATLEALAQLTRRDPFNIVGLPKYYKEISAKENDRGAALLLAANVENALQAAIEKRIVVRAHHELFGFESPIGTFENKIRIAFALNIVGEQCYSNLICIKAIRNAFAHARAVISFDDSEVLAACDLLTCIQNPYPISVLGLPISSTESDFPNLRGRAKFQTACEMMSTALYGYRVYATDQRSARRSRDYVIDQRPIPLP